MKKRENRTVVCRNVVKTVTVNMNISYNLYQLYIYLYLYLDVLIMVITKGNIKVCLNLQALMEQINLQSKK